MKTIKLILAIAFMNALHLNAQEIPSLNINGLEVGEYYTDAQVRAALGVNPLFFLLDDSDSFTGDYSVYRYGTNSLYDSFRFLEDGGFSSFSLSRTNYTLYDGRLKVGDDISKIYTFDWGVAEYKGPNKYRFTHLYYEIKVDCWLDIYVDSMDKIIKIVFINPQ